MSIASIGSAHPLRQTSFPPDEAPFGGGPRSPSVGGFDDNVSMVSGSAVSATGGSSRVPRKRGRKSKAEKAREAADKEGTPSVAGGKALTVASGRSGGGGGARSAVDGDGPEDDEEDDAAVKAKMGVAQFERSREEREEEKKLRFMLVQQMDADQAERYEMWHAAKFAEASVRRVSRSVRFFSWSLTRWANTFPDRQRHRFAVRTCQRHQGHAVGSQSIRGRPHRSSAQGAGRVGS